MCIVAKNYKPKNFGKKLGMGSAIKKVNRYKALYT